MCLYPGAEAMGLPSSSSSLNFASLHSACVATFSTMFKMRRSHHNFSKCARAVFKMSSRSLHATSLPVLQCVCVCVSVCTIVMQGP
jgi:hypothetical protein